MVFLPSSNHGYIYVNKHSLNHLKNDRFNEMARQGERLEDAADEFKNNRQ
jgi:hypothetical protein